MSDPFLGEIKLWMMSWAPKGWALCDGSLLTVSQNQGLYALIGVQFGGNPTTNFNLPDMRGRVAIGYNPGATEDGRSAYAVGANGGAEGVTLTAAQVPGHTHSVSADTASGNATPATNALFATVATSVVSFEPYTYAAPDTPLNAASLTTYGGGEPHANVQPFAVLNFAICTSGLWPPRP